MIYTTTHSRAAFSFMYITRTMTTLEGVEGSTRGPGGRAGSTLPMPRDGVVFCAARLEASANKSWVPILSGRGGRVAQSPRLPPRHGSCVQPRGQKGETVGCERPR